MNVVEKKFKYIIQIFPLIKYIENWWEIIFSYLSSGRPRLLRLRNGVCFVIKHHIDALTIKESFIDKDYDVALNNPLFIIDIGANIGTEAVFFSRKYPKCRIYSFEPANDTYKSLKINLSLNDCKNTTAEKLGVSGKSGSIRFYSHPASGLSSVVKKRDGMKKETIKTITLEDVFKRFKITKCDLLKIDSEGSEYETLFNAPKSLFKKIDNIVLEYHDGLTKYNHEELVGYLKRVGYKIKIKKHKIEDDIGIIYAR
jgi:FkbM family methyltransferase